MPVGRPTNYSPELAASICQKISNGNSLRRVCLEDSMPYTSTIFVWLVKHPEFKEQYEKACAERSEALVEEMLDIADDKRVDVQRSRLMVETRKWIAAKLKPKKYGEGLPGNQPINGDVNLTLNVNNQILKVLTLEQLEMVEKLAIAAPSDAS